MSDAQNDVFYIRDRRLPFHYTIDNEVYDMDFEVEPGNERAAKEWRKWKAILAYNALARHASYEGEERERAAFTHKNIAQELGVGVTTIKNGLEMLVYNKLIALEKKPGGANSYWLLEVPKVEHRRKYVRRNASNHASEPDRRNASTPRRNESNPGRDTSKGCRPASGSDSPKAGADKGIETDSDGPKRKSSKEKISARGAQSPPSEPQSPEDTFIGRVLTWHDQCAKVTKANYRLLTISYQLKARIRQIGLKRAKEIFEHCANGVKPDVHAFWQQLNKEGEASKVELTRREKEHADIPVEVKPEKQAVSA